MKDMLLGIFPEFNHPEKAECLMLSSYTHYIPVPSKYISGDSTTQRVFNCPKCGKESDNDPEHGYAYKCGQCYLCYQCYGNALYIWEEQKDLSSIDQLIQNL
jgi:hypothetical protein